MSELCSLHHKPIDGFCTTAECRHVVCLDCLPQHEGHNVLALARFDLIRVQQVNTVICCLQKDVATIRTITEALVSAPRTKESFSPEQLRDLLADLDNLDNVLKEYLAVCGNKESTKIVKQTGFLEELKIAVPQRVEDQDEDTQESKGTEEASSFYTKQQQRIKLEKLQTLVDRLEEQVNKIQADTNDAERITAIRRITLLV